MNDPLSLLSQTVDFASIARSLDGQLLLQQLYNLSDDALEYQLLDRHSFVHFAGLEHSSHRNK